MNVICAVTWHDIWHVSTYSHTNSFWPTTQIVQRSMPTLIIKATIIIVSKASVCVPYLLAVNQSNVWSSNLSWQNSSLRRQYIERAVLVFHQNCFWVVTKMTRVCLLCLPRSNFQRQKAHESTWIEYYSSLRSGTVCVSRVRYLPNLGTLTFSMY